MIHPCGCTAYNGGQCYNCLNGAHNICNAEKRCRVKTAKVCGVVIVSEGTIKKKWKTKSKRPIK